MGRVCGNGAQLRDHSECVVDSLMGSVYSAIVCHQERNKSTIEGGEEREIKGSCS